MYVFFCEPIKNNIIINGNFIKILYSTPNVVLNGIYLFLSFKNILCEKYFNKNKYIFSVNDEHNSEIINYIQQVETSLLNKINIKNKIPLNKMYEQIKQGFIKIFTPLHSPFEPLGPEGRQRCNEDKITNNLNNDFLLKISGLWESETCYGVTYKFIKLNT
jgi:hypothetical protein